MKFNVFNSMRVLPVLAGALVLTGCGGDDESSSVAPPLNLGPSVSTSGDGAVDEKLSATINATAADQDGSIVSFEWTQTSGTSVDFSGATTDTISFAAPIAKVPEDLVFKVTVQDDDGAVATDTATITVMPVNEIDFEMKGMVTNGIGIPSDIEVSLGGGESTVTSDSAGLYSLRIEADEDAANDLLVLKSIATDDPEIVFANIPVPIGQLWEQSEGDNILDAQDNIGVNLTPLSTAFHGLMLQENDAILTQADVEAAITNVDAIDAISLATAIKIISENNTTATTTAKSNAELGLPEQYEDTLAFTLDRIGSSQFIASLNSLSPDTFTAARASLLGDPDITKFSGAAPASFPHILTASTSAGFVVDRLTMNSGGTGYYSSGGADAEASWSQDADGLITVEGVGGAPLAEQESFPYVDLGSGNFQQVRALHTTSQVTFTPILDLPVGVIYERTQTITLSYPDNPGLASEDRSSTFQIKYINQNEYLDFDIDGLFGSESETQILMSFFKDSFNPIVTGPPTVFGDRQFHYNADYLNLSRTGTANSGTVTSEFGSDLFSNGTWEMADAKTLKISFDNNRSGTVEPLDLTFSKISENVTTNIAFGNGINNGIHNGVFAGRDMSAAPASEADAMGFYTFQFGLGNQGLFWNELKADNVVDVVTVFDFDGDGVLEQTDVSVRPAKWELTADGEIVISHYRHSTTFQPGCDPDVDANCVLQRETKWNIADRDGGDIQILNQLRFFAPTADNLSSEEYWFQTTARNNNYSMTAPIDVTALPPG